MLALPETLTLAEAKAAVQAIEQALGEVPGDAAATAQNAADNVVDNAVNNAFASVPFIVDASGLRSFDTAAIAVLIEARRLAQAAGRSLAVRGAPASMLALAEIYGVAGLLGLGESSAPAATGHSSLA